MLKIFEVSDKETFDKAIKGLLPSEKLIIVNPAPTIHYLGLQYFKRLLFNFEHINFTFILNTDNDLTVCLEAIDLCFPYIIFSGVEEIMVKLHSRAAQNNCYIFPTLNQGVDFVAK